jgi:hypothetical protein
VSTHPEEHDVDPGAHATVDPLSAGVTVDDKLPIHARMQAMSSAASESAIPGIASPHAGFAETSLSIK